MAGVERRSERLQDGELAGVAARPGRQPLDDGKGLPVQPDRLGVPEPGGGHAGGALVVVDRPRVPPGSGVLVGG